MGGVVPPRTQMSEGFTVTGKVAIRPGTINKIISKIYSLVMTMKCLNLAHLFRNLVSGKQIFHSFSLRCSE